MNSNKTNVHWVYLGSQINLRTTNTDYKSVLNQESQSLRMGKQRGLFNGKQHFDNIDITNFNKYVNTPPVLATKHTGIMLQQCIN